MGRRSSPRQWLLIGLACGLVAVLAVRSAVFLLVGGAKVLALLAGLAIVWLVLWGPRRGRR